MALPPLDIESGLRARPRLEDFDIAPAWAALGTALATGGAPLGAALVGEGAAAGRLAAAGALGGFAVGSARCLLDLALPPPGDCPRFARNVVFTFLAVTVGPLLGTLALSSFTDMQPTDPILAVFAGAMVVSCGISAVALVVGPTLICRAMFVGDCL